MVFRDVVWEECGEPVYSIYVSSSANTGAKIELKVMYFPGKEESVFDDLLEFPHMFSAVERSSVIDREEKLVEDWRKKSANVRLIDEEWIEIFMPEMVRLEPKKIEERARRKKSREKIERLLEQMRRFGRDEEGDEEEKEIREKVRTAIKDISRLMVRFEEEKEKEEGKIEENCPKDASRSPWASLVQPCVNN